MLTNLYEIEKLFICPVTKKPLHRGEDGQYHTSEYRYENVNGTPVLVDFEKSILEKDSMLNREGKSAIKRGTPSLFRNLLRDIINLQYQYSFKNVESLLLRLKERKGSEIPRVLIIGGATLGSGMDALYKDPGVDVIAFDIYKTPYVQFVADAHSIPIADHSIDAVVVQAVLEHVLDPQKVVGEIYRILKTEGFVYAETPFLQHVHEGAYDFTRFTESGHRYLFNQFFCLTSGPLDGPGSQLIWSLESFFRSLFRSRLLGKIIKMSTLWLLLVDYFIPRRYWVDGSTGNFFWGKKMNKPICPREMIEFYKGDQHV